MAPHVVVVGSANTDLVCKVERLPAPGETVLGGRFFQAAGGKGANQAVAAARLGAHVTFVARLGNDDYAEAAVAGYQDEGIDTRYIVRDPQRASGVALILVAADGENCIAVAPGANACLAPSDLAPARAAFASADVVLVQLEIPLETVAAAVALGRECGATVILNPAPAPPEGLPDRLLAQVNVLTPNQTEAALLVGQSGDDATLARALQSLGVGTVVLTRGAEGALWVGPAGAETVAAPAVSPVDTTAAGDAFNGALAVALAERAAWSDAVAWACCAGATAATREGAQPSLPTRDEVNALFGRALGQDATSR